MTGCTWAQGDPLMAAYHDSEWGVPVRDPRLLWEMLVLEGFQAGLSWRTILHRREGFRRAFDGFAPAVVAGYGPDKVDALMQDEGIIRARAKIEATIGNARAWLRMAEAGEDFSGFLWDLAGGAPRMGDGRTVPASTPASLAMSKALKAKGFKFVGAVTVYAFMQAVGMVNDHALDCPRRDACAV
ncbi:DNA-3-methyladenine glycosylase I [Novosphingobium album (ex Liu et al. 2023)]|uniref:DNA-3-methyladenine glycosylase I n=1 Tax=Novosphingobium album (ex Liu et al. 2023) TaxID=3031130 RepID=A0ABT5WPJ3_9SPHN|nr:DNA-3-methyladenine glycosylase I [Novosphingobium album (ex Liu et al. 2023)]MDE8651671.1 DNA-3-methyladenine glycosylase I [Novosphingobium album (ex Liu et al. 2023)]